MPRGWLSLWEPNVSATCEGLNSTGGPPPLSIVIPHMGGQRRSNLGHLIAFLLSQPFMRHPSSEIVINHGCNLSWSERGSLDDLSRRLLTAGPRRSGQKAAFSQMSKTPSSAAVAARVRAAVTHLLGPRTELFAASRYFAAAEARNEVIVSMDDDVMPFASQADLVEALSCSVRRELLSRLAAGHARIASSLLQRARLRGQAAASVFRQRPRRSAHPDLILLTNFAALSRSRLRQVTARLFDERYTPAMLATRGNGEDIALAKAVGRFVVVPGHVRTVRYKKGYSTAAAHMAQRALLCCCLAEGLAGAALAECVRPTLPPGQAADPADYSTAKPRARLSEWRQRGHRGVAAGVLSGGRRSFRVYECVQTHTRDDSYGFTKEKAWGRSNRTLSVGWLAQLDCVQKLLQKYTSNYFGRRTHMPRPSPRCSCRVVPKERPKSARLH